MGLDALVNSFVDELIYALVRCVLGRSLGRALVVTAEQERPARDNQ
jgi:hypothetical protein